MDIERSQGVKFTRAWKDMKVMEKRDGMAKGMVSGRRHKDALSPKDISPVTG